MYRQSSIGGNFATINKCDICHHGYDRSNRQPVIICSTQHTICRECMLGLQSKPNCPFCREPIQFNRVVVNNYLQQLLPQYPPKPNARVEIPQNNQAGYPAQANYVLLSSEISRTVPNNQNYQYVYTQPHHEPQKHQQQSSSQSDASQCDLQTKLCCGLYTLLIPLAFLNLLFSFTSPQSECMDVPHRSIILILRPWLKAMGIIEVTLMLIFVLIILAWLKKLMSRSMYQQLTWIVILIFIVKAYLWLVMEFYFFGITITRYCSGGIYAYGVVLTIIHVVAVVITFIVTCCRYGII